MDFDFKISDEVPLWKTFDYLIETEQPKTVLDYHFLKIVEQIKEITGIELRTVPILGEEILSKDLLISYTKKPKEFGEGVVLNFYNGIGSCKSKSLDYLGKISQEL